MKLPFIIKTNKVEWLGKNIIGFSFGLWIFTHPRITGDKYHELVNHEKIHFIQQVELFFIGQWIMYVFFYTKDRLSGMSHSEAYWNNPFEKEAHKYESNLKYIKDRKRFNWILFT